MRRVDERRTARHFLKDSRGGSNPIEFALLLPLFLLLLFGLLEIWKIIALKESLDRGVLQAAEYWSTCPPPARTPSPEGYKYKYTAEQLVRQEVENHPLIRPRAGQPPPDVELSIRYYDAKTGVEHYNPADIVDVFEPFIIEARLVVPWGIGLPMISLRPLMLRSRHVAFKELPYQRPTPTPIPTPTPTSTPTP